jgi:hypothetical protein
VTCCPGAGRGRQRRETARVARILKSTRMVIVLFLKAEVTDAITRGLRRTCGVF